MEESRIRSEALNWAVRGGQKQEILNLLSQQNSNNGDIDDNGNTVLHLVLKNKKLKENEILDIIKDFPKSYVNPNIKNKKKETALHLAVARRLKDVVDYLFMQGAKIEEEGSDNMITHYFIEDEFRKFNHILELKEDNLIPWDNNDTEEETVRFVKWMLDKKFNFDAKDNLGHSALKLAINRNLLHILPTLLNNTEDEKYLDGDFQNLFSIFDNKKSFPESYYEKYFYSILQTLLDNKNFIGIENTVDFAFFERLSNNFPESIEGYNFATSLFHAFIRGCGFWTDSKIELYILILNNLIAKGVNVNTPNSSGLRPIFWALTAKQLRVLQFLFENLADFQVKNSKGQNLLSHLLERDFRVFHDEEMEKVFEFLIDKGCDVNEKDNSGSSPLNLAVRKHNIEVMKKLIELGAKVNCRDNNLRTPLHYAVMKKEAVECAELLLKNGANVNARDKEGKTPLHGAFSIRDRGSNIEASNYAEQLEVYADNPFLFENPNSQITIIELLVRWGAEVNVLHAIEDKILVRQVLEILDKTDVNKLLKYGLEFNNSEFCRNLFQINCDSIKSLMEEQWIKLHAANLSYSEEYAYCTEVRCIFYEECLEEVEKLKNTFIDDEISLYNFLQMHPINRYAFISNEKFKELVGSPEFRGDFPNYANVVLVSCRQAATRKLLLASAKKVLRVLTKFDWPDVCMEKIFAYLNNMDLINIIESN